MKLNGKINLIGKDTTHIILTHEDWNVLPKPGSFVPSETAGQGYGSTLQRLYFRVVLRAIQDCCITGKKLEYTKARDQARAWFLNNSEDYQEVCSYAAIDPHWLLQAIRPVLDDKYKLMLLYKRIKTLINKLEV
jgi:hypothetical protein